LLVVDAFVDLYQPNAYDWLTRIKDGWRRFSRNTQLDEESGSFLKKDAWWSFVLYAKLGGGDEIYAHSVDLKKKLGC
jgi:hypothetical protein